MSYENPKPTRGYRDLVVWQRSVQLARQCDTLSGQLWNTRRRSIADQLLRAGVSIPSNIAEGQGVLSRAGNVRHLTISLGSLREVETLFEVFSEVLSGPDLEAANKFAEEVARMLTGLIKRHGTRNLKPNE